MWRTRIRLYKIVVCWGNVDQSGTTNCRQEAAHININLAVKIISYYQYFLFHFETPTLMETLMKSLIRWLIQDSCPFAYLRLDLSIPLETGDKITAETSCLVILQHVSKLESWQWSWQRKFPKNNLNAWNCFLILSIIQKREKINNFLMDVLIRIWLSKSKAK